MQMILFPACYGNVRKVDPDFEREYEAVKETRCFRVLLFGYDQWITEGKLVLSDYVQSLEQAIYRGWMMKPEQYQDFYQELLRKNIMLMTAPEAYEKMHVFPNIYKEFGTDTAKLMLFPLHEQIDVNLLKNQFERFMVKDYVKSVKGTSFPKYFDSSITQASFDEWMQVFYGYRGNLLTGGICIKEYLDLRRYDGKVNEYRVFYAKGQVISKSRNSGQPNYTASVPEEMVKKYTHFGSPYYTVDFAELTDGTWKVMEAGDGSVSGLSEGQDILAYYRALYQVCNDDLK